MHGYFDSPEELQAAILEEHGDTVDLDDLTDYLNELTDYVKQDEFDETYDDMLDTDGTVTVGGIEYYPSRILKEIDPIAYRCGLTDYIDALSEDCLVLDF